jgi:hypothetical protein
VRNAVKTNVLLTLAIIGAGLVLAGCKSAPPLAQDQALAMIQAKYDATPAAGANITVNNDGMLQGATAKYWSRTTIYPNKYWADFTLTPDGKKLVKLTGGGDLIKWRPDSPTDKKYSIVLVTVTANHLKARDRRTLFWTAMPGSCNRSNNAEKSSGPGSECVDPARISCYC